MCPTLEWSSEPKTSAFLLKTNHAFGIGKERNLAGQYPLQKDASMTKQSKRATLAAAMLLACLVFAQAARADEGMWTFDNFPSKTVGAKYGFTPAQAWLDHVRLSSLPIAGGCSAAFISPQ